MGRILHVLKVIEACRVANHSSFLALIVLVCVMVSDRERKKKNLGRSSGISVQQLGFLGQFLQPRELRVRPVRRGQEENETNGRVALEATMRSTRHSIRIKGQRAFLESSLY